MNGTEDETARTRLASERTQMAWWRTGLAALAVALAVGRVVPELAHDSSQWPYTVIGVGFAVYGIALIGYGTAGPGNSSCTHPGAPSHHKVSC